MTAEYLAGIIIVFTITAGIIYYAYHISRKK